VRELLISFSGYLQQYSDKPDRKLKSLLGVAQTKQSLNYKGMRVLLGCFVSLIHLSDALTSGTRNET